jgi:hypothetical protein
MNRIFPIILLISFGCLRAQDIGLLVKEGNEVMGAEVKTWGAAPTKGSLDNRECKPVRNLFGLKPLRLLGTLASGKFVRIDALIINQGVGYAEDTFETEYTRLQSALPEAISNTLDGEKAVSASVPPGFAPETRVWMWCAPQNVVTATFEPHKRVTVTVRPITELENKEAETRRRMILEQRFNSRAIERENGDVVIEALPEEEAVKTGTDITPRVVSLLQKYYGWKTDMPAFWKRMDGATGDESTTAILLEEITKEAGAPFTHIRSFEIEAVMTEITKGRLVVVRRAYNEKRQVFLGKFSQEICKVPSLTLPPATDQEDRKKWATGDNAEYAITSVVVGFNRKRGEFLIAQPGWGSRYRELRIRAQELQAGVYESFLFGPKQ